MTNDATLAPARKVEGAKTLPTLKTVPANAPIENEAFSEAALAMLEHATQEPYYEPDAELRDVRNITILVQWIERARLLSEKVRFWQQHSPQFAKVTDSYSFDAPSWEDAESEAFLHLAIQQESKLCDLMKHLEGSAS